VRADKIGWFELIYDQIFVVFVAAIAQLLAFGIWHYPLSPVQSSVVK
jgi:low temperature requirement protein LtrA